MLDPKLIKEKPQIILDMLKARSVDFDLNTLIEYDQKRRKFIIETDELRKKKNQVALDISQKKERREGYIINTSRDEKRLRSSYKIRIRARNY